MLYTTTLFCLLAMTMTLTSRAQEKTVRLLSYNIRNAKGLDNKTDYDRIAAVLKNAAADVTALQELDSNTRRSGNVDVLQVLVQKTGWHGVFGSAISYAGGQYGVGILAREKPLRHYTVALPGREEQRVLLVAEFHAYVVFCTHLSLVEEDRLAAVALINREAAAFSRPVFLLGDLNAEPASAEIGLLKKAAQLLSGGAPTFPANEPWKCLDYIFVYRMPVQRLRAAVLPEPLASDHRPVLVELVVGQLP